MSVWRQASRLRDHDHADAALLQSRDALQGREHVCGDQPGVLAVATIIAIGEAVVELSIGYRAEIRVRGDTDAVLGVVMLIYAGLRKRKRRGADWLMLHMATGSRVKEVVHVMRWREDGVFGCLSPPVG